MSASSSHFIEKKLDIAQQDSEQPIQQCIVLTAPLALEDEILDPVITRPIQALEKHGCKVTLIGDGKRDLNQADINQLLSLLESHSGRTLLYIKAHGFVDPKDGHIMAFGKENATKKTTDFFRKIASALNDKPIDIVSSSCFSAHVCEESVSSILPPGSNFVGLNYKEGDMGDHISMAENLLVQPVNKRGISAEKMLLAYLTLPISVDQVNPEICSIQYSKPLADKLLAHVGKEFNAAEKEAIYRELSSYMESFRDYYPLPMEYKTPVEMLDMLMGVIENKNHDYFSKFPTKPHPLLLAVAHAASKASQKPVHVETKQSTYIPSPKEREKTSDSSHTGSNMMKMVSYGYWKKNEWLLNQLKQHSPNQWVSLPFKAVQHVLDFSGNLMEDKNVTSAGIKTAVDMVWEHLIKRGPALSVDLIGSAGDFMVRRAEKQISELERSERPGDMPSQKLELLYEGRDFYNLIRLPKLAIDGVKKLALDTYEKIFPSKTTATLLNHIAPSAKEGLQNHSDYLLYRVQKLNQQSMLASDFMRTAAFKDELYRLQMENNLSSEQTQLLALYTSGRYTEHKTRIKSSTAPNPALLKKSLQTLQTNITRDLSQHPDKSTIFKTVQQTSRKSQAIIQDSFLLERHDETFRERIQQTSWEINAVTGFCSQLARVSGASLIARKMQAIGSGAAQCLSGVAALSMGNPLGLLPIFSSFLGLFDDEDDDDNGMSIISSQISEVHHDMMKGFNEIRLQQIDIARGLVSVHHQTMSRFDHVDYNLGIIQQQINQTYQYLTAQNNHISHQIGLLSQQLSEGLQAVHTDIMHGFKVVSEGMSKGFTHLDEHLSKGFDYLDQEVKLQSRDMRAKISEQILLERQYFESLNREQMHQSKELKQHSLQLTALHQQAVQTQKKQINETRKEKERALIKYAEHVLLDDFAIETFNKNEIEYNLSKAMVSEFRATYTPKEILSELGESDRWQEMNPFDVIHLLHPGENVPLVHFPTQQKNLLAMVKWLTQKKTVPREELFQLKNQVKKIRDILHFCHALAKPDAIERAFSEISANVATLGNAIEQQLITYNNEYTDQCCKRLQHMLKQHENNRDQLKKDELKEVLACLADRLKQPLEIKVFDEKVNIVHAKPQAYFVYPAKGERLQYALPLSDDKLPPIPKEILALEALEKGWIHFSYRFNSEKNQLKVRVKFQLSSNGKSYPLLSKQIEVKNKNDVINNWRQFTWPTEDKVQNMDELNKIYEQCIKALRLELNDKLQQDLSCDALQVPIEAIEASVGLLHARFRLIFESFYLNKDQTLQYVLQSCLTADKIKQLLLGYSSDEKHPFFALKNAKKWYAALANYIIDALTKDTLYVDNVTLTNALLLLDNALLEFMPKDERLAYLNHILETSPEASLFLLRGTIFATEKHDLPAALVDYRQASALNPDDNQIRSKYADALFALGDMAAAIREYTKILKRMDDSLVPRGALPPQLQNNLDINKGVILLSRGDAYLTSGYPAAALDDYQIACQVLSDQPEILYKIGLSYQALDKLDLASVYYQKVLNIEQDHYDSMIALATCLFKQNKKVEAFVWYQRLLEKNPASIEFNFQCAECSPKDDKRTVEWLLKIIKHPKASIQEVLRCSELALKKGELPCAQVAYDKIKNIISTAEQYKRCVKICLQLEDPDECRINKEKLEKLLISQRIFKQVTPHVISNIRIGKKYVK